MKEFVKKISVSFLSLIVLLSSMSFVVNKHYCGDELVDVSIFGDAQSCCEHEAHTNSEGEIITRKCCKDVVEFIESTTFDKEKLTVVYPDSLEFLAFYFDTYFNLLQDVSIENSYEIDFSPPNIDQDVQVLYQTFLI